MDGYSSDYILLCTIEGSGPTDNQYHTIFSLTQLSNSLGNGEQGRGVRARATVGGDAV